MNDNDFLRQPAEVIRERTRARARRFFIGLFVAALVASLLWQNYQLREKVSEMSQQLTESAAQLREDALIMDRLTRAIRTATSQPSSR